MDLPHESNPYTQRLPCAECKANNLFTRVVAKNKDLYSARYLCRNCTDDYVDKKEGWHVITTRINLLHSTIPVQPDSKLKYGD